MCLSCFHEYTDEPVVNGRVAAVYDLIAQRGEEAEYSHLLHIMVGDMNLEDHWFDFDGRGNENLRGRYESSEGWEREIFDGLAGLSEPERATAVAMSWGYFDRDGQLIE